MNNTLTNKTLMSLAFIKVNWDNQRRKDYIDNFIPFLATLIVKKDYKEIKDNTKEIKKFISDFKEEFGLLIPYHPMMTILNRAKKRKIIKKQEHKFIPTDKIYKYDFSGKTEEQERKYGKIIKSFKKFAEDNYNKDFNDNELENILIKYLKQYDLKMLFAAYGKSALPDVKIAKSNMFIFSKFVENINKEKPNIFQILLDISVGHMLVNIILYGSNIDNFSRPKLKQLNMYIDTRIIFRLLGIECEDFQKVYDELLVELKKQCVNLFVFRHTYNEVMVILNNSLHWLNNPSYDGSKASIALRYFKSQGYKESDVQIFINRIGDSIADYGIKLVDASTQEKYIEYQIDEIKLYNIINDTYNNNFWTVESIDKENTIQRDVKSISTIYTLRKGAKPENIKQAKHIFMTTNSGLAFANKIFEREEYEKSFYIPTCVTDTFVGTLIWMRNPQKITEIKERELIANIYSALQPNEEFLKQFLSEVKKLREDDKITENDYIFLRDSQVASQMLMEETLGDPDSFSSKTPFEILERIKKEGYLKYIEEKNKHENTKQELEDEKKYKDEFLISWDRKSNKIANYFSYAILIIFIVLSVIYYFKSKSLVISLFLLIFGIISLLGIHINIIKEKVKRYILRIFGIEGIKNGVAHDN
jgi:hypothetical protein